MAVDERALRKPVKKLRKALQQLHRSPSPSEVKTLRTATRRVEAAAVALELPAKLAAVPQLEDVRKGAGKVRDMDVLTALATRVHPRGETECSVQLLEHLGARRAKYARKLRAVVKRRGPKARARLKKLQHRLGHLGADPALAAATALRLQSELEHPGRLSRASLHPFRLKVKELRNTLRLAAPADLGALRSLEAANDALGEWHDWEALLHIAAHVLAHGRRCRVMKELEATCARKYEVALREAGRLRSRFHHRRELRAAAALARRAA